MPPRDPTVIINPVALEEPDGYRGQRRRFLLTHKGGGAALPALLVVGSVIVVLIVVGVSQLLPRGASGQIPLGGGNGGGNGVASDDNGQPQADGSLPGTPSGSAKPSRGSAARPTPSPSGGVSVAPGAPGVPPVVVPTTPTSTQTSASPPPPFTPVTMEAEKATLGGTAKSWGCSGCSGGTKVRWIGSNTGWVTVTVTGVPSAGPRKLVVTYELGEPYRYYYFSVNGGGGTSVKFTSNITDWSTPLTVTLQVSLSAGTNTIKFYNPTADAPDLDKVTVK
jgi:hypothetical protein